MRVTRSSVFGLCFSVLLLAGTGVTARAAERHHHAARPVPQPNMREALGHLAQARAALRRGTSNKGGHRAAAIRLVEQATREVELAIRYDNHH